MDYARLFGLILRFKWLLLVVVIAATSATFVGARLKGASYQASATLMPQEQALQTMEGVSSLTQSLGRDDMLRSDVNRRRARTESLIALMLSPRVLGQVIAKLELPLTPSELERLIEVERVTPEVLRIHVTTGSPETSSRLVNGLVSNFVSFYGDLSTNAIAESIRILHEREAQARTELSKSKAVLQQYKASRQIYSSLNDQMGGIMTRLNMARQAKEETKTRLGELQAQLALVETQFAQTPETMRVVERSNDSLAAQQ
jgi:uncharacterized protein involved in exopolysaccharide biosynthesis